MAWVIFVVMSNSVLYGMNSQTGLDMDVENVYAQYAIVPSLKEIASKHVAANMSRCSNKDFFEIIEQKNKYNGVSDDLRKSIVEKLPMKDRYFTYEIEGRGFYVNHAVFDPTNRRCVIWEKKIKGGGKRLLACDLDEGKVIACDNNARHSDIQYGPSGEVILIKDRCSKQYDLLSYDLEFLQTNVFDKDVYFSTYFCSVDFCFSDSTFLVKRLSNDNRADVIVDKQKNILKEAGFLRFSSDGSVMLSKRKGENICDVYQDRKCLRTYHDVHCASLSKDGKILFVCYLNESCEVIDLSAQQERKLIFNRSAGYHDVDMSSDGSRILLYNGMSYVLLDCNMQSAVNFYVQDHVEFVLDDEYVYVESNDNKEYLVKLSDLFVDGYKVLHFVDFICDGTVEPLKSSVSIKREGKKILFYDGEGTYTFKDDVESDDEPLVFKDVCKARLSSYGKTALFMKEDSCIIARAFDNFTFEQYALKRLAEAKAINEEYVKNNKYAAAIYEPLTGGQQRYLTELLKK